MPDRILHNFRFDLQRWEHCDALKVLPFHVANFYLRMFVKCTESGELPAEPQALATVLRAPVREVRKYLPMVMPWFQLQYREIVSESSQAHLDNMSGPSREYLASISTPSRTHVVPILRHKVVDEVRESAFEKIDKLAANGRKGGTSTQSKHRERGDQQPTPPDSNSSNCLSGASRNEMNRNEMKGSENLIHGENDVFAGMGGQPETPSSSQENPPFGATVGATQRQESKKRKRKTESPLNEWQKPIFEEFWSDMWRKESRLDAENAFAAIVQVPEMFEKVQAAKYKQMPRMLAREVDKRPYASTWLNGGRFNDEESPAVRGGGAVSILPFFDRKAAESQKFDRLMMSEIGRTA